MKAKRVELPEDWTSSCFIVQSGLEWLSKPAAMVILRCDSTEIECLVSIPRLRAIAAACIEAADELEKANG